MEAIVDQFYTAIRTGATEQLYNIIHEDFVLTCPTRDHVLSGVYQGKTRFFNDVLPHVFGCVESAAWSSALITGLCAGPGTWLSPWPRMRALPVGVAPNTTRSTSISSVCWMDRFAAWSSFLIRSWRIGRCGVMSRIWHRMNPFPSLVSPLRGSKPALLGKPSKDVFTHLFF